MMTKPAAEIPPHDFDYERGVLGAAFHDPEAARAIAGADPALFWHEPHRAVQRALVRLEPSLNGSPPDLTLVRGLTAEAGEPVDLVALSQLYEAGLTVVHVEDYLDHLRELAARREKYAIQVMLHRLHEQPRRPDEWDESLWQDVEARLARAQALRAAATPEAQTWPLYDPPERWSFPPVAALVDALLPLRGVTWWGGMPKRYKSLLLLYVCLAIACGRPDVARRFSIRAHPLILFVAREDGGSRLQERIDDVAAAWGIRPPPGALRFVIQPKLDLLNPGHVTWLRETCRREGITLLVLDTWTALSPSADPLGARDQAQLAAVVVGLAEAIAGHVVVVDHSRKNRPQGQVLSSADIFGPPQKWAAAEHIVMLDMTSDGRRLEVFVEGKDLDGARFLLDVSPRGSGREKFTFAGAVADLAEAQRAVGDANRQAIHQALAKAPDALALTEILASLPAGVTLARDTVQKHLKALVTAGKARMTGEGRAARYFALSVSSDEPSPEKDDAA
jgi:hypothetical protein